jgi:hypothetical protein
LHYFWGIVFFLREHKIFNTHRLEAIRPLPSLFAIFPSEPCIKFDAGSCALVASCKGVGQESMEESGNAKKLENTNDRDLMKGDLL